jgi:hypothetical protein
MTTRSWSPASDQVDRRQTQPAATAPGQARAGANVRPERGFRYGVGAIEASAAVSARLRASAAAWDPAGQNQAMQDDFSLTTVRPAGSPFHELLEAAGNNIATT